MVHQNNSLEYNALSVEQFLEGKGITVFEYPPYSSDLALYTFYLFPKVKTVLKGTHFQPVEDERARTAVLLNKVTFEQGDYVERDR